jgi:triacylglycerol esterase/lipase EstA (alpha/beta hydrolase family)
MERILYIHGANATPDSFNYIKSKLPTHRVSYITYDANDPLESLIELAANAIVEPSHIVAHSLGGVIAVAVSQRYSDKVLSVTTMATPFGGSEAATRASVLLPFSTFLKNIHTHNPTLREIIQIGYTVPTTNIVTTAGSNMFEHRPNDGVVTLDSQRAFNPTRRYEVDTNHFEVLLCPHVIQLIEERVWPKD